MATYINLTNRLLRRLNEVEISSDTDFLAAIGIQAAAKDAVLDTIREINTRRTDWAFNAVEHTQVLAVGVEEYAWRDDFAAADWNSFQLQKDDDLNVNNKTLNLMSREEWYKKARDTDYNSGTDGRGIPDFVFPTHGNGWGVTPSPNELYTIKYRYYKNPEDLEAAQDETEIPSRFDYVIMSGALIHMGLFKEDNELVAVNQARYEKGLSTMVNMLTASPEYMHATGLNYTPRPVGSQGYWWY